MNTVTMTKIAALGAVTGIRSMAGLTTLAAGRGGLPLQLTAVAAAAEMLADKTSLVGKRTDPLPLAGRAVFGAAVGALVAREHAQDVLVGSLLGAGTAILAAHLAYQLRKRLPGSGVAGGLLEDGLVLAIAASFASNGSTNPHEGTEAFV